MDKKSLGVVFDLDDTLYLERDYVRSGFRAVGEWCAERLGVEGVQQQALTLFDQGRRGDIFDAALRGLGVACDPDLVSAMVRVYRDHLPSISLPADAVQCLKRLEGRVHLGLLTDGYSMSQRLKIEALGLAERFEVAVVTGDWGTEYFKPHVRGFRYLESHLGGCSGRFLYVADNPAKDFFAPRALGWQTIRVRRAAGLHVGRECPAELAALQVQDLEPVPDAVFQLLST